MSGKFGTAVGLVAAATVLAVTGSASAAPDDPVDHGTESVQAGETTDAGETLDAGGTPVGADRTEGVGKLLADLQKLYREAEEASEAFNATEEKLKVQRKEVTRVGAELGKVRTALAESRRAAGHLAREQYKGRSDYAYSSLVRLLTARDPEHALMQGHTLRRAAAARAVKVARLEGREKRADELATKARGALDVQQTLAARQKKQRDAVQGRLKRVEGLLASLSDEELTALARLEERAVGRAQQELVGSGAFGPGGVRAGRTPSRQGAQALAYGTRQLGKPYVWGAEGPGAFDCSGLTQQAWAAAGRTIPRTSQEQWRYLPRVPLSRLRPGDLVVYFPKATHVAIYLGNGQVVQAPRPGARVKVSPIASNPVLGAVRPDPALPSLPSYVPPDLPVVTDDAGNESDAGYGSEEAPG
ncbi:C40 family peptidase [Streptomyces candidus]|uniref:Cell wall-associated NlpC family hydrolase n=1 Tax=Streptomyces candidus TaxID=67283 RepID=A0A7X0HH52_9ACTN|nr:C40 family peptidase [Streptomyces candidus]MBB6437552.1 cell wall-associated NlpC family hydrolase [Streptomyces candidus]